MQDTSALHAQFAALANDAKAWPFAEARNVIKRLEKSGDDGKRAVVFETGYGPSGLPHIGTFGEVVRTSMVRLAFEVLTGRKTRLICFSDDMDGFRKVPDNVPNREMLADYIDQPLTRVPDPFEEHPSFGAHNNARLCAFLDSFGFDYEFMSATARRPTYIQISLSLHSGDGQSSGTASSNFCINSGVMSGQSLSDICTCLAQFLFLRRMPQG